MTFVWGGLSAILSFFLMTKHPLSLVLMLIAFTTLILIYTLMASNLSWLSMILFLVFLGGLLIIFTYLSALVPNEVHFLNLGWLLILLSPGITSKYLENNQSVSLKLNIFQTMNLNETSTILMFLSYLLITLMVTMVMAQYLKSPLSQSNY